MTIRAIVADDHAVFRAGIIALLEREGDVRIVGEAGTGPETLAVASEQEFDVLIMDLGMPESDGPRLASDLLRERPEAAIVVLTMHEDPFYLQAMLQAGALGFVVKRSSGTCLLDAIRAARRGQRYVDPSLAAAVLAVPARRNKRRASAGILGALTAREREVCGLIARGHTSAEIGRLLFISDRTVDSHRTNIMEKLGLKTRSDLVRFALENGLLTLAAR